MGWVGLGLVSATQRYYLLTRRTTVTAPLIHAIEWLWRLIEFYYLFTCSLSPHYHTVYNINILRQLQCN